MGNIKWQWVNRNEYEWDDWNIKKRGNAWVISLFGDELAEWPTREEAEREVVIMAGTF
jgi:hypothetical protein